MQSDDTIKAVAEVLAGSPREPACVDSRSTPGDAYALATVYEQMLERHGLSALYRVEVQYVSADNWGIFFYLELPAASDTQSGAESINTISRVLP
jgi:hypothetical protein